MSNNRSNLDKEILLKAFDSARAWSSLIVTLSTGAIVFTAIFRRDFTPPGEALNSPCLLVATWVLFGIAAFLGVGFLAGVTATLNKGKQADLDVYGFGLRMIALIQILVFIAALVVFFIFLLANL